MNRFFCPAVWLFLDGDVHEGTLKIHFVATMRQAGRRAASMRTRRRRRLGSLTDITVKGLEIVKKCRKVYLEAYTSVLPCGPSVDDFKHFYGKEIILADRQMLEENTDAWLDEAIATDVCLLVVGDPLGATTHGDLLLRATHKGIRWEITHNASIINAVACCGLQLYCFGETVSIPFWDENWQPDSFFDKITANKLRGLHTLCLLDIKVKEQTVENLLKGRKIYEPPRYMSCAVAASQLLEITKRRASASDVQTESSAVSEHSLCVGLARVGWDSQKILVCSLGDLALADLGAPLHCLIVAGHLHPMEEELLRLWKK